MKRLMILSAALLLCGCGTIQESELQEQTSAQAPLTTAPTTMVSTAAEMTETQETEPEEEVVVTHTDPQQVIQEMILYHGHYDRAADKKVRHLLKELTLMDARKGKLWTDIMAYWDYANNDLPINVDTVPEGLPEDDTMAFAVLGFELNDDGTMQDELAGRLELALKCAEQYPNAYVICTGGGTAWNNPSITEAGLMGEWMLQHGLDSNRLIVEDKSRTTAENARNSYDILLRDYPQVNAVVLISSSYHIAWGSLLFEAAFMESASEKQAPEIHVIDNTSCPITNSKYLWSEILRWETGGLLQMIGNDQLAMQYYLDYEHVQKPVL